MSWGGKKQAIYISIITLLLVVSVGIPVYFKFFKVIPTCFDGKLNQNELDVDCGGVCKKLCQSEALPPLVVYERIFTNHINDNFAVALIENLNKDAYAKDAKYYLKIYDQNNILLEERVGSVFIPTGKLVAISEHSLYTGERKAFKAVFEFMPIEWQRGVLDFASFEVSSIKTDYSALNPSVEANIMNNEVYDVLNVEVIAYLFDEKNNLIEASQTFFPRFESRAQKSVVFKWPKSFVNTPASLRIYVNAVPRSI